MPPNEPDPPSDASHRHLPVPRADVLVPPDAPLVHVWAIDLRATADACSAETLSDDERERSRAFRRDVDRTRWIRARTALRKILARYLDDSPGRLVFEYGSHGKPSLAPPHGSRLSFNLSHAHELAVLAVCRQGALGVDIEYLHDARIDMKAIATQCFTEAENAAIDRLPDSVRSSARMLCWTCKEAYVKATGRGLSDRLDAVVVRITSPTELRLLSIEGSRTATSRWSVSAFDPGAGYTGALVLGGTGESLRIVPFRHATS